MTVVLLSLGAPSSLLEYFSIVIANRNALNKTFILIFIIVSPLFALTIVLQAA